MLTRGLGDKECTETPDLLRKPEGRQKHVCRRRSKSGADSAEEQKESKRTAEGVFLSLCTKPPRSRAPQFLQRMTFQEQTQKGKGRGGNSPEEEEGRDRRKCREEYPTETHLPLSHGHVSSSRAAEQRNALYGKRQESVILFFTGLLFLSTKRNSSDETLERRKDPRWHAYPKSRSLSASSRTRCRHCERVTCSFERRNRGRKPGKAAGKWRRQRGRKKERRRVSPGLRNARIGV